MSQETITKITELLSQAGSAHHHFEQTVLNGVYDQEWPAWYADYVITHGLAPLLPTPLTADQLGQILAENYEHYQKENPKQGWAEFTAQQIATTWKHESVAV
jgi:hypothetical protein